MLKQWIESVSRWFATRRNGETADAGTDQGVRLVVKPWACSETARDYNRSEPFSGEEVMSLLGVKGVVDAKLAESGHRLTVEINEACDFREVDRILMARCARVEFRTWGSRKMEVLKPLVRKE